MKVGFEDATTEGEVFTTRAHMVKMSDADIPPSQGAVQAPVDHLDESGMTMTVEAGDKSATISGKRGARAKT